MVTLKIRKVGNSCGVTLPKEVPLDSVNQTLVKAGATVRSSALVGSHATRYTVAAEKT